MDGQANGWMADQAAQRLLFDLDDLASVAAVLPEMERIPKGEPVRVRFRPHQSLRLRLGKHDFILVSGPQFLLIDDSGADVRVGGPRCVVGRGTSCGAIVGNRYRAVSRKHLIIEIEDDCARITDISSLGTWLPAHEF